MPPMFDFDRPGMFNARNLIAGALAVVVVLGAWFGLRSLFFRGSAAPAPTPGRTRTRCGDASTPPEEPEEVEPPWPTVLVATQAIFAGDLLQPELLEWRMWRHDIELANALVQEDDDEEIPARVLGAAAKLSIAADTPILRNHLVRPGFPGYITAVLAPGHRAVPVRVDDAAANAGIIHPGDSVDLTLVYRQGDLGPVAQVIVSDVRVLSIGARFLARRTYGMDDLDYTDDSAPSAPSGDIYTLELTPRDADRIALATTTGEIKLTLRSDHATPEDLDHRALGWAGGSDGLAAPGAGSAADSVRIIRGPSRNERGLGVVDQETVLFSATPNEAPSP